MVLAQGLKVTAYGLTAGIAGAFALARLLGGLLFGVSPGDPLTFAAFSLLLASVVCVACYVPARRAARLDPIAALRYE